jgi:hypothetical protein
MRISRLLSSETVRGLFMEATHYSQEQIAAITKWAILKAQGKAAPKDTDKLNDAWEKLRGTPAFDNFEKVKHLIDGGRADNMIEDARQDIPWVFEKAVGESESFTPSQKEWGAKWMILKEVEGSPVGFAPKNQQCLEAMWEEFEADVMPDLGKAEITELMGYWIGEMDALNVEVMDQVRRDLPFLFIGDAHVTNTNDYDPQMIRTTETKE